MKQVIVLQMIVYLIGMLAAAFYHFNKTKKMNSWRFLGTVFLLFVVAVNLFYYAQQYQAVQMVVFALSFTLLSNLFFFTNGSERGEWVLVFNFFRFILHVQLLVLLYLLR